MPLVHASRRCLMLLLLLSVAQQWRLIAQAPLAASDAVEFVTVAQRIGDDGLAAVIRRETVPPLFPALVYAVHALLSHAGWLESAAWGRAAQLAAAGGLITAVVPIFLFASRLFGRRGAVAASILFCLLPASSRLGVDGIADAWHLAFVAAALWMLVEASHTNGRPAQAWSLAAGVLLGLALLCRAEALVIGAAVGLGALFTRHTSWRTAASLGCGVLGCLVPYVASGVVEPGAITQRLRGGGTATAERPLNFVAPPQEIAPSFEQSAEREPLIHDGSALEFGRKDRSRSSRMQSLSTAAILYVKEFLQACGYIVLPLAAVGAWRRRRGEWASAAPLLGLILALFAILSFTFVVRQGYITSRHFLLPIVILLPFAGRGIVAPARLVRLPVAALRSTPQRTRGLTAALAGACLLATLRPLHYTHAAHRSAADWLQSSAAEPGAVLDQFGWTALSTGRTTYRFDAAEAALTSERLRYVVVERVDLEAASPRGVSLRAVLGPAENAAECFADVRGRSDHDVLIFRRTPHEAVALRQAALGPTVHVAARRDPSYAR